MKQICHDKQIYEKIKICRNLIK